MSSNCAATAWLDEPGLVRGYHGPYPVAQVGDSGEAPRQVRVVVVTCVALVGPALTGVLLAVLGALVPLGWAAATRVATALRAE